jgi:hypothetical protein
MGHIEQSRMSANRIMLPLNAIELDRQFPTAEINTSDGRITRIKGKQWSPS